MNNLEQKLLTNCVVSKTNCWEWQAAKRNGYGCLKINGKVQSAHRLSYIVHIGDIPDNYFVCHHCDNPSCINPDHLFLGTRSDNMKDAASKNRLKPPPKGNKFKTGHISPNRKLTNEQVVKIQNDIDKFYPAKTLIEIAKLNKIDYHIIAEFRRKKKQAYFN